LTGRQLLALALLAGTTGCVEKVAEQRVHAALLRAGLSEHNADCMAKRMVDRLTISQLRELEALQGEKRSIADYVALVERMNDTKVLGVTASSAALCATGLVR
jgi:hypothetical protein